MSYLTQFDSTDLRNYKNWKAYSQKAYRTKYYIFKGQSQRKNDINHKL